MILHFVQDDSQLRSESPVPVLAALSRHVRPFPSCPTCSRQSRPDRPSPSCPTFPVMADLIGRLRHARLRPGIYTENKMDYDLLFEMK